jgi:hypothetical protein
MARLLDTGVEYVSLRSWLVSRLSPRLRLKLRSMLGRPPVEESRRRWFEPEEIGALSDLYFAETSGQGRGWDVFSRRPLAAAGVVRA